MPTGNGKTAANKDRPLRATGLRFQAERLVIVLDDDREVSVPLKKYPTLQNATASQRRGWELLGDGEGFHWESLDLDLSTLGVVNGYPESIPKPPALHQLRSPKQARRQSA